MNRYKLPYLYSLRPYHVENTGCRQITEVRQRRPPVSTRMGDGLGILHAVDLLFVALYSQICVFMAPTKKASENVFGKRREKIPVKGFFFFFF